jgi:Skp family chaperone for outer membrane proteins
MRAHVFVLVVLLFAGSILQAQQGATPQSSSPPLSVADVEHGLKAGVSNTRMAALVKQYGVDFDLSDAIEKQLRAAGATGDLLLDISRSRHSFSAPPISIPPSSIETQPGQQAHGTKVATINIEQAILGTQEGRREISALGNNGTEEERSKIAQNILKNMAPMIVKFSNDNGFGVALDISKPWPKGQVLWVDPKADITKPIISVYDGGSSGFVPTSDDSKLVTINLVQAIFATEDGKRKIAALNKTFEPRQTELKRMSGEAESLKQQFKSQGNQLNADARASLSKQIDQKQKDYDRSRQEASDDWEKQANAISSEILNQMAPLIIKLAQNNGYGMVIDTSNPWPKGVVLWSAKGTDITKQAVDSYNAGNMSSAGSLGSATTTGTNDGNSSSGSADSAQSASRNQSPQSSSAPSNTFEWWYCVDAQTATPTTNTNGRGPWLYIVSSVFHGEDGGGYENTVKEKYAHQFHEYDSGRFPGFLADDPRMKAHATCWPYQSQTESDKNQQHARPYYDSLGTRVDSEWKP